MGWIERSSRRLISIRRKCKSELRFEWVCCPMALIVDLRRWEEQGGLRMSNMTLEIEVTVELN
jgi:hypothetical protein